MRLAILLDTNKVLVEYKPEEIKALLCIYFDKYQNIPQAFDKLVQDLKNKTMEI